MRKITFLMITILCILLIAFVSRKNKNTFRIFGVLFLVLLIFIIGFSSFNKKIIYTAPTLSQVNEYIAKKSIYVLSIKETENFTVILFENGQKYGYYILSNDQNNELYVDGVTTGGHQMPVFISVTNTGKTPFVTVIINNEDILRKASSIELSFKDGSKITEKILSKGTIVTYHNEKDNEQMPYEKLIIYDKDMKKLYEQ